MKQIYLFVIAFVLFANYAYNQTLSNTYQGVNSFSYIKINTNNEKYCTIDKDSNIYTMQLYNVNDTAYQSITFNVTSLLPAGADTLSNFSHNLKVYCIAEELYDTDKSDIESFVVFTYEYFNYSISDYTYSTTFYIIDTTGTVLFQENNAYVSNTNPLVDYTFLMSTQDGAKMVLTTLTGDFKVYNLSGVIPR